MEAITGKRRLREIVAESMVKSLEDKVE